MSQPSNKQDQYGLFSVFPTFVYRGKLATHEKWKEILVPILEKRYRDVNGSNSNTRSTDGQACWNCDCYTSFFDESMQDHTKEEEIEVQALLADISVNLQEAIKSAEFYPHAFLVAQQWFNAYGPGQNQEPHNHVPSHLSGIYYITFDPNLHSGTTFLNPNKMYTEGPRYNKHYYDPDMFGYGCYKEEMSLTVAEGDVVIFPSQMEHMVQRQPTIEKNPDGKLRMTFSFNVELVSEQEARERLSDQLEGGQQAPGNPNIAPSAPAQDGEGGPQASEEWSSDWF
tara:strand:+ start:5028 stop:5876 length:849 start_codon:yes stop_codon:yes gene_type:complete